MLSHENHLFIKGSTEEKPTFLKYRKTFTCFLQRTWSLAKPDSHTHTPCQNIDVLIEKVCPAPHVYPSLTISPQWSSLKGFARKSGISKKDIAVYSYFVLSADCLIKLSSLHWQRDTWDNVWGIIGEKIGPFEAGDRRKITCTYSKSLYCDLTSCLVQQKDAAKHRAEI